LVVDWRYVSGKIIHIDFGDCFEVAMHRERYSERIPFRLTRMLIKAMGVRGDSCSFFAFLLNININYKGEWS